MPSGFSAKDNKALVAACLACQKITPTALMISLAGAENGRPKYSAVCLSCANNGWRPPGFSRLYQPRYEITASFANAIVMHGLKDCRARGFEPAQPHPWNRAD